MNGQSGLIPGSELRHWLADGTGGVIDIIALWKQQQPMPAEYSAVVDRRFWDLIDADRRDSRRRDCAADTDNGEVR